MKGIELLIGAIKMMRKMFEVGSKTFQRLMVCVLGP
jgi:hypothetical protein